MMKYRKISLILFYLFLFINSAIAQADQNKSLYLLYPRGTETFYTGDLLSIEWYSENIEKINIEKQEDEGEWKLIANDISAEKKNFKFVIPDIISGKLKMRISDSHDPSFKDVTPYFVIIKKNADRINSAQKNYDNISVDSSLIRLMPLGNSITRGYIDPPPEEFDGYRKPLKFMTEKNGLKFNFVGSQYEGTFTDKDHEGRGGWHTDHWYYEKEDILDSVGTFIRRDQPDIVLLHIGTNDIGEYDYPNIPNDDTIDSTVTNISKIIDSIFSVNANIEIILAKIIKQLDDSGTLEVNEFDTTAAFNIALETMANLRIDAGDNIRLVDMENAIEYPTDLCDAAHPTEEGYEKMAGVWFNGLLSLLPKLGDIKVYFQGAYDNSSMSAGIDLPLSQPFNSSPWNYEGLETVDDIPANISDWVLVSLRETVSANSVIAQRAAFVKTDGMIVDLDGISHVAFTVDPGEYYVVIQHRNHIPVMSASKILLSP